MNESIRGWVSSSKTKQKTTTQQRSDLNPQNWSTKRGPTTSSVRQEQTTKLCLWLFVNPKSYTRFHFVRNSIAYIVTFLKNYNSLFFFSKTHLIQVNHRHCLSDLNINHDDLCLPNRSKKFITQCCFIWFSILSVLPLFFFPTLFWIPWKIPVTSLPHKPKGSS